MVKWVESLPIVEGWKQGIFKVPSNLIHFMILWGFKPQDLHKIIDWKDVVWDTVFTNTH